MTLTIPLAKLTRLLSFVVAGLLLAHLVRFRVEAAAPQPSAGGGSR